MNDDCALDVPAGEVGVEVSKVGKVYKEPFPRCVEHIANFLHVHTLTHL